MPDDILGGQGGTLLSAIAIVAVALLALAVVIWLIRGRSSSTFVRGGRARQPRLAVLDAAAVDTRRRIVLIRRDDVEHLVMIGGPTDVVIESRIAVAVEPTAPMDNTQARSEPASPHPDDDRDIAGLAGGDARHSPQAIASAVLSAQKDRSQPEEDITSRSPLTPVETRSSSGVSAAAVAPITATAGAASTIEAEAADILDTARARVFQEQVVTGADQADTSARSQPAQPATGGEDLPAAHPQAAAPLGYDEYLPEPDGAAAVPAAGAALPPTAASADPVHPASEETVHPAPEPAAPDFEEVLAAELSEDLELDPFDDALIEPDTPEAPMAEQGDPDRGSRDQFAVEPVLLDPATVDPGNLNTGDTDHKTPDIPGEAPAVEPETGPSRDSLEAEMERLLGDLSRKS